MTFSLSAPPSSLGPLEKEKFFLLKAIERAPSRFNIDIPHFNLRIQSIFDETMTQLLAAFDPEEKELVIQDSLGNMRKLRTEWPVAYAELLSFVEKMKNKIEWAKTHFKKLDESQVDLLNDSLDQMDHAKRLVDEGLASPQTSEEKNALIKNSKMQLLKLKEKCERDIRVLSLQDTADKIIARADAVTIAFHNLNFDDKIEAVTAIVRQMEELLDVAKTNEEKDKIIDATWEKLNEIDIEIEKENALQELKKKYEEFEDSHQNIVQRDNSIQLSDTTDYARESYANSFERIQSLSQLTSPNTKLRLHKLEADIAGATNLLSRAKWTMERSYGEQRIGKALYFLKHQRTFEGDSEKQLQKLQVASDRLLEQAKKHLEWGESINEGVSSKSSSSLGIEAPAKAAPPMISLDKIEAIANLYISFIAKVGKSKETFAYFVDGGRVFRNGKFQDQYETSLSIWQMRKAAAKESVGLSLYGFYDKCWRELGKGSNERIFKSCDRVLKLAEDEIDRCSNNVDEIECIKKKYSDLAKQAEGMKGALGIQCLNDFQS